MYKTTADIEGMMCNMCEKHVNEAIKKGFKVKKVTASHEDKNAVILSKAPIERAELERVIEDTGYKLTGLTSEEV